MPTTSTVGRGHCDAANRSTGATRPLFAVRPAPAPRSRPLRGRRGVRAAPPHVPHPCALHRWFALPDGNRRTRLTNQSGSTVRGAAPDHRSPVGDRSAALAGLGLAVRSLLSLRRGEACRRARGRLKGGAVSTGCGIPKLGAIDRAPSHAAPAPAASAWYVCLPRRSAPLHRLPATTCGSPCGVKGAGTTLHAQHH
jgi:hypothetical protein